MNAGMTVGGMRSASGSAHGHFHPTAVIPVLGTGTHHHAGVGVSSDIQNRHAPNPISTINASRTMGPGNECRDDSGGMDEVRGRALARRHLKARQNSASE
jgi:hypothetical protein